MNKQTAVVAAVGVAGLLVVSAGAAVAGHARFDDGPFGAHEAGVHFVADAGITAGCNADGTRYCPSDSVTRAQMGTFMHRLSGNGSIPPSVNAATLDGLTAQDLVTLLTDQYYVRQENYIDGYGGAFCNRGDTAISGSYIQRGEVGLIEADLTHFDEETQQDGWLFSFQDASGTNVGEGQVTVLCQESLANRAGTSPQSVGEPAGTRTAAELETMVDAGPTTSKPRG